MPLPSLAAIAVREGTFQQGGGKHPPPPAMLDQKKPGRIRVKLKESNRDLFPPMRLASWSLGTTRDYGHALRC